MIAVDGYASTGKSTLAKKISAHLGIMYVDSGFFYRYATYFFIKTKSTDLDIFYKDVLQKTDFSIKENKPYLNEFSSDSNELRSPEVSNKVSEVSSKLIIRDWVNNLLHKIAKTNSLVMDGRDIGTVVFPDAKVKLFVTAKPETRAERRLSELVDKGFKPTYEETLQNIVSRDYADENRETSPLTKAKEAIVLDNTNITLEEFFSKGIKICTETL